MAAPIVQFRADEEVVAFLRGQGLNPNDVAREAFAAAFRALRASQRARKLLALGGPLPRSVVEAIRQERESH